MLLQSRRAACRAPEASIQNAVGVHPAHTQNCTEIAEGHASEAKHEIIVIIITSMNRIRISISIRIGISISMISMTSMISITGIRIAATHNNIAILLLLLLSARDRTAKPSSKNAAAD